MSVLTKTLNGILIGSLVASSLLGYIAAASYTTYSMIDSTKAALHCAKTQEGWDHYSLCIYINRKMGYTLDDYLFGVQVDIRNFIINKNSNELDHVIIKTKKFFRKLR